MVAKMIALSKEKEGDKMSDFEMVLQFMILETQEILRAIVAEEFKDLDLTKVLLNSVIEQAQKAVQYIEKRTGE